MDMVVKYIKENKLELISVFAIFVMGICLRLAVYNNFGAIWYDELFSWFFASRESVFETIRQSVAQDIHMPLYFILLHFWIKIFGDDTNVMRMFSFCLTLPLIPMGYYLAKKLFNRQTAYYTAIFFAINT
ncbi:glycosyltransferase family 39 protein, partial [bacterium]|nr:glycosyltransferase family 39 protein [bacterium]